MYSNDYNQIKAGLINYVGAMLKACPFEGMKSSRQYVAATLIEQAIDLMKDDDNHFDMYVSKPLLRGTSLLLKDRDIALSTLNMPKVSEKRKEYKELYTYIDNLIKDIKE